MANIRVGDKVIHKGNPDSVPCDVLEVVDLGHGEGYERVKSNYHKYFWADQVLCLKGIGNKN